MPGSAPPVARAPPGPADELVPRAAFTVRVPTLISFQEHFRFCRCLRQRLAVPCSKRRSSIGSSIGIAPPRPPPTLAGVKEVARLLNAMREAVRAESVAELAARHGLTEAWVEFRRRFLDAP